MNDVLPRLEKCFQVAFPNATVEEIRSASIGSIPEWDSLATLTLVALVEEEFRLSFPVETLGQLISFELIADEIQQHNDSKAA